VSTQEGFFGAAMLASARINVSRTHPSLASAREKVKLAATMSRVRYHA
jgi:hypothetical protein